MPTTEHDVAAPTGRRLTHPSAEEIRLETVLHAMADPIRLTIVRELADGHADMACIAFDLPVSKSTTTHHFKVLREAGVIRQHYEGTSRMSRLREADLEARFPGLLAAVLEAARRSAHAATPSA
ncbi:ArsR family transcriptional regulator [Streptomyces sp. CB00316]|uniref:ArsR/SmtB family transcription factor n=1 Tax=unclassified Streptomyces TaxID=2593676 RepID=UPI00093DB2C7|nr:MULTISPECIES: metalloregulator ArsR/SmtB family transcription factor [unclassified Streptomyces]MBT2376071.1 helix-turn-helix transcriptional regulator [Streptomyces sp. ISL-111]MBT2428049.1 helix-turn-helix transcriptional regulator [Streptomyces sp. ISL-112]MBT2463156.1 helix-turn-helix transcriptional regulator [Streptomyces sp. ISL-63]OKJ18165.1 ArsR family transcriptional regulator [Streptomyces sp. CB00316]